MVLKDWKKWTKDSWIKPGKDKKNPHLLGGKVVSIQPKQGDWINGKFVLKKGYTVEIDSNGRLQNRKSFKTKTQALKYVKSYMRKH